MTPSKPIEQLLDIARRGERTLIVGILNVTPDSFSDGGQYLDRERAIAHGVEMVRDGADILDIGGESTRPGAQAVPLDEELARAIPVIEALSRRVAAPISIDTRNAPVAERAIEAGAVMVNDVSAMSHDPAMAETVGRTGAAVCLMHMRGTPETMQQKPEYDDVVAEIRGYLALRMAAAMEAGIRADRMIVDPGLGFGKTLEHNLEALRNLRALTDLGAPVMVGASRKAMLGALLGGAPPEDRFEGSAATTALAIAYGASLVRVHDVRAMARVARVADAIVRGVRA